MVYGLTDLNRLASGGRIKNYQQIDLNKKKKSKKDNNRTLLRRIQMYPKVGEQANKKIK